MIANIISVIISLFVAPLSLEGNNDTRKFDEFLWGRWIVASTNDASVLESVSFAEGKTLRFTFKRAANTSVNILQHYAYHGIDSGSKTLSLSVYTKDLFSEQKVLETDVTLQVINYDQLKLVKDGQTYTLDRSPVSWVPSPL